MRFITLVFALTLLITTPVFGKAKFNEKRFNKIEAGMTLNEVTNTLGKKVSVLTNFDAKATENYLMTTYLEQHSLNEESNYMILTYSNSKMAMWSKRIIITTASVVISDGLVVLTISKSV